MRTPVTKVLWLGQGITETLQQEASRMAPYETGGLLLGWSTPDSICVTSIVGPGPSATHRRKSLLPDHKWQSQELARAYEQSGRRLSYLGDWHTHPGGSGFPSNRDKRTLRGIALHADARCPSPVMLILGQSSNGDWTPAAHLYIPCSFPRRWRVEEVPTRRADHLVGW